MKIPATDSISALAEFWDTHDVTEFADQLEEVDKPVFARSSSKGVTVPLSADELRAVRGVAASCGLDEAALIRSWVQEKLRP